MATNLSLLLEQAQTQRNQQNWPAAQRLYLAAAAAARNNPQIHHNLALCLHAQGRHAAAHEHTQIATKGAPQLVPAWILRAKVERAMGQPEAAEHSLHASLDVSPNHPQTILELADLTLHELCDARETQRLVQPLLAHPQHAGDAQLANLMAKLYDRDESAEAFTQQIIAYSRRYLRMPGFRFTAQRKPRTGTKNRVGLLSPLFSASPVYFFTYGSLSLLAEEVDFVILNRGTRSDWATAKFRAMAAEWHDLAHLPAEALANALYAQDLDVLIDLGGWTDPIGLKALSSKPAPKMYKWVGGQSCTTGLDTFDGFISDAVQTPEGYEHLYTEPLIRMEGGYVSYTPPEYMPAPRARPAGRRAEAVFGVVCNPVKLSQPFIAELGAMSGKLLKGRAVLRFIDRRYASEALRLRTLDAIAKLAERPDEIHQKVEFMVPKTHLEYLEGLAQLDRVIDTFPYNGGLTTVECLRLGVRSESRSKDLFCERHSLAHFRFSGTKKISRNWMPPGWQSAIGMVPHEDRPGRLIKQISCFLSGKISQYNIIN